MAGVKLGREPVVDPTATVRDSVLGTYTEVGARTSVVASSLGDYSYVVHDADLMHARVGRFCSLASFVRLNPGDHPMERASQSHFTYRASAYFDDAEDDPVIFARRRARPVTVGHDVWIGHGAVVLAGRSVGDGAVIGAGSVVTRDVAPYAVVAGNPARVIRERFPARVAERLRVLAWWDWDHARLRSALDDFRNLSAEAFLDRHEGDRG